MQVYLAARYDHKERLQWYKKQLEAAGHTVVARWLEDRPHAPTDLREDEMWKLDELRVQWAQEDLEDIQAADWVICFTETRGAGYTAGGRHVEFGIALAGDAILTIIGPRENIFHYLEDVQQYDSWEDFVEDTQLVERALEREKIGGLRMSERQVEYLRQQGLQAETYHDDPVFGRVLLCSQSGKTVSFIPLENGWWVELPCHLDLIAGGYVITPEIAQKLIKDAHIGSFRDVPPASSLVNPTSLSL